MDAIYRLGRASVADVRESLSDPPSYSAVRAMLGFLEDKGYLRHERVVKTFFNGSAAQAAAALIEMNDTQLSQHDVTRLSELIKKARQEGR